MKLLFLNHNVRGRGTYVRAFHLGRELVRRGHEVVLVTTSERARWAVREEEVNGVRVVEMPDLWWGPARTGWDPYNTIRRIRRLRASTFDVVHAFDSRPAVVLPALRVAAECGAPLVMDWADWWGRGGRIHERSGWLVRTLFGPVETWFEESFRSRAAGATVICSALGERLQGMGYPDERILRLPNGCVRFDDMPSRSAARASLGLAASTPLLVHVGRIMRPDLALVKDALARALQQVPALRLVFVGATGLPAGETSGPGLSTTGFVSERELQQWLSAADAGILPMLDTIGHRGRWPGKLSDYMSAGVPAIVTRVGDVAGLVEQHGAGWVVQPDATSLANAFVEAVRALDRHERGGAGRALANGALSWCSVAGTLDAFYGQVTNDWKAAA